MFHNSKSFVSVNLWGRELETQGQNSTGHSTMYDIDIFEDESLNYFRPWLLSREKKNNKSPFLLLYLHSSTHSFSFHVHCWRFETKNLNSETRECSASDLLLQINFPPNFRFREIIFRWYMNTLRSHNFYSFIPNSALLKRFLRPVKVNDL